MPQPDDNGADAAAYESVMLDEPSVPAEQRKMSVSAPAQAEQSSTQENEEVDAKYQEYYEQASKEELKDIAKLGLFRYAGVDDQNRPVVVFVGENLPKDIDYDRLFLYFIKVMHSIVKQDYVVVYVTCMTQEIMIFITF